MPISRFKCTFPCPTQVQICALMVQQFPIIKSLCTNFSLGRTSGVESRLLDVPLCKLVEMLADLHLKNTFLALFQLASLDYNLYNL